MPEINRHRIVRSVAIGGAIAGGSALLLVAPGWIDATFGNSIRSLNRQSAVLALDALLVGHAVVASLAGAAILILAYVILARVRGRRAPALRRCAAPGFALLVSLGALEIGAACWHAWLWRGPRLPAAVLKARPDPTPAEWPVEHFGPDSRLPGAKPPLKILVLGESSARGEPYHPWLSVGQIVGWRLERIFPDRPIEVDIWAYGGATLEIMHKKLAGLTYRPDVMIVYVGHNEFQGRYPWSRQVDYYLDEDRIDSPQQPPFRLATTIARFSSFARLALEIRDQRLIDLRPPRPSVRALVDRPCCTPAERAAILENFRYRLDTIASFCDSIECLPVYIIPPANDSGFDPSRSILEPDLPRAERVAFAQAVEQALALDSTDRVAEANRLSELVAEHPGFAETQFQLARLLARKGRWDDAKKHYVLAREDDALPLRCPESFRQAYRDVAAKHSRLILIDGPRVLEAHAFHGILSDQFFHDAQHPNLAGYAALSQAVLDALAAQHALDWPKETPTPRVDLAACARRFQMSPDRWAEICRRESWFFDVTASIRYDPTFRNRRAARYLRAAHAIHEGKDPADANIPGWPFPPKPPRKHSILESTVAAG